LIVVDDNSPDDTAGWVRQQCAGDRRVRLYVRTEGRGLATAIRYGIERAAGDIIVAMDTDFQHDPRMIPQMVKFCEYYDVVVGSRFVMGGGMAQSYRYYYSYVFNLFVRLVTRTQIQDNLSGFFAMRRAKLMQMDLDRIFQGYGEYFIRLLFYAWRFGYAILEVPVFYRVRYYGASKSRLFNMLLNYGRTALSLRLAGAGRRRRPDVG
jgi:dolichol-phosphate mannosyltransferase